jgi:hypothetical protein
VLKLLARGKTEGKPKTYRKAEDVMNPFEVLIQTALLPNEILHQHLHASGRRGVGRHTANLGLPTEALYHETEVLEPTAEFACLLGRLSGAENPSIRHDLRGLDDLIQGGAGAGENLRDQQTVKQEKRGGTHELALHLLLLASVARGIDALGADADNGGLLRELNRTFVA